MQLLTWCPGRWDETVWKDRDSLQQALESSGLFRTLLGRWLAHGYVAWTSGCPYRGVR